MKRREVFFHLARLFAEWPEWDEKEYAYKAGLGHRLAGARDMFLGSDCEEWCTDVVAVLDDPTSIIIDRREQDTHEVDQGGLTRGRQTCLRSHMDRRTDLSPLAHLRLLGGSSPEGGPDARRSPQHRIVPHGGCGVEEHPPMRITHFREAWEALGYPGTKANADPPSIYDQALRNFDRLCEDAADRNLELRNRLDAQGLVWSVMHWDREDPFVQQRSNEDRTRLAQLRGA